MNSTGYKIVKQEYYKGEYKTEVLSYATSYYYAVKELRKIIREINLECLEYDITIGIMDDLGALITYVYSRRV